MNSVTVQYTPDPAGLAEFAVSLDMQTATLDAAAAAAAAASIAHPAGNYVVSPKVVRSGYRSELRAGAAVTDDREASAADEASIRALNGAGVAAIES